MGKPKVATKTGLVNPVKYSRAGDVFHYRWAAIRCISMLYPNSDIEKIVIEGSSEKENNTGEYTIDVSEYRKGEISYVQLKYSTVRIKTPFILSEFKETFKGFASKYKSLPKRNKNIKFHIVSNRIISPKVKNNLSSIAVGKPADTRFKKTLAAYTDFKKHKELKEFCKSIILKDDEKNLPNIKYQLLKDITQVFSSDSPDWILDRVIALVSEKATAEDSSITKEDIFQKLGISSDKELFPAPSEFENIKNKIYREQHSELMDQILKSSVPIIIHAAGGVGKSIFAQQIVESLPKNSIGVIYDCFAGGKYRSNIYSRHRFKDGIIQITNELASKRYCPPTFITSGTDKVSISRTFNEKLKIASNKLERIDKKASLVIVIDAADNAALAARDSSENCFVEYFVKEDFPSNCKIVLLCRTERIHLLKPSANIKQIELKPFSITETKEFLKSYSIDISNEELKEFHKLTNKGNPRVQSKAIKSGKNIQEILKHLGPSGTSVEDQIKNQLDKAIEKLRTINDESEIDNICMGISILPPFVPIKTLSAITGVSDRAIQSFISDLDLAFWTSDNEFIHFKDEPTETWFRDKYGKNPKTIASYIKRILPLAQENAYVAEILPSLLLRANKYNELINLALNDDLKLDNPIENRAVKVSRLKFAFKAAIRLGKHLGAFKIACLLGEEVAGEGRQLEIFKNNIDLIAPLCGHSKVQEIAFKNILKSSWEGSNNLYSAALLSYAHRFEGESNSFLRVAERCLKLYWAKDKDNHTEEVTKEDIIEFACTYYNLRGIEPLLRYLLSFRDPVCTFIVTEGVIKRFVDKGDFKTLNKMLSILPSFLKLTETKSDRIKFQYIVLVISDKMLNSGHFPDAVKALRICLDSLSSYKNHIVENPGLGGKNEEIYAAFLSFLEVCLNKKLSKRKILNILEHYFNIKAPQGVTYPWNQHRNNYFRQIALRKLLNKKITDYSLEELIPTEFIEKKQEKESEIKYFGKMVQALSPWHDLRIKLINGTYENTKETIERLNFVHSNILKDLYGEQRQGIEISGVYVDIFTFCKDTTPTNLRKIFSICILENKNIYIHNKLKLLRNSYRLSHLKAIRKELEGHIYEKIKSDKESDTNTKADLYIALARAVLSIDTKDAMVYFDDAIKIVSKFGYELPERWRAIAALAEGASEIGQYNDKLAYDFFRSAEFVGDNVGRKEYFHRKEAVRICARISPHVAISFLSRWRDRDVGYFHEQIGYLAYELIKSKTISPSIGWALSSFFKDDDLASMAELCLEIEPSKDIREHIIKNLLYLSKINEVGPKSWEKINAILAKYNCKATEISSIIKYCAPNDINTNNISDIHDEKEIVKFCKGINILSFNEAYKFYIKYKESGLPIHHIDIFWKKIVEKIKAKNIIPFLNSLEEETNLGYYDVKKILSLSLSLWSQKVSVQHLRNKVLKLFGKKFALSLSAEYNFTPFIRDISGTKDDVRCIQDGIFEGLKENVELFSSEGYFGFIKTLSPYLSPKEAEQALIYAMKRLEAHIENDYGDGPFSKELLPAKDISMLFSGFIWAALASPDSEIRWRAAHVIRTLAELNCTKEIESLIKWMNKDEAGPFVSKKLPFYNLHARLYLLIAFSRISIDKPEILKKHLKVFICIALDKTRPHILIQKFAIDIVLNIFKKFPDLNTDNIEKKLCSVIKSPYKLEKVDRNGKFLDSFWHKNNKLNIHSEIHHGWDFEHYWFQPLGTVFGISEKQICDIVNHAIYNERGGGLNYKKEYHDLDPRKDFTFYKYPLTAHSHGSCPIVDNYYFYISYHSMMIAASLLLQKMPIIEPSYSWEVDPWEEWLSDHLLARKDGKWLSDRRDPPLLTYNNYEIKESNENWIEAIGDESFLNEIIDKNNSHPWIRIHGYRETYINNRMERVNITSALVSEKTSIDLMHALQNVKDKYAFALPSYKNDNFEFNFNNFELKGLVRDSNEESGLDKFDPFYGNISYPPYEIGGEFVEQLKLKEDSERRMWFYDSGEHVASCNIWGTNKDREDRNYIEKYNNGKILNISMDLLKKLCKETNKILIINIQVIRRIREKYTRNWDNGKELSQEKNKVYLFNKEGRIISAEGDYRIS